MAYLGMDMRTGRRIVDRAHLDQSIHKVLTTAVGTRLRRRPFGSLAPDLVDAPANGTTVVQLYTACVTALMSWEPRLVIHRITARLDANAPGGVEIILEGETLAEDGTTTQYAATVALGA